MTDAHCHVSSNVGYREFLIGRDFVGIHPWDAESSDDASILAIRAAVEESPNLGVGEIGLDRLHDRQVSSRMREVFEMQLRIAADFSRPVVLHGAKCWGQVVAACKPFAGRIPAFLFHGFSRSDGLIPDITALNGFISVGPAVLNDHAVNYRKLVRKIPAEYLLLETDRTSENASVLPSLSDILAKTAELRGTSSADLEHLTDANAARFLK